MKSKNTAPKKTTITTNYWKIPSAENALDGWLEGNPSDEEKLQCIEAAIKERAAWKPSEEAMLLVDQLKSYVGTRVQIQLWSPFMYWSEAEGPDPLEADCKDILILQDEEFLQAYLVVDNIRVIEMVDGHSPLGYLVSRNNINGQLAPLSEIYEICSV